MAERPTWRENLTAALVLLVLLSGTLAAVWVIKVRTVPRAPQHVCPYCGQEIKVELEKNGEKKP